MKMVLAIQFNFSILISFLLGIVLGLIIAVLIYLILVLSTMNKNKKIFKPQVENVDSNEIVELIESAKKQFKDETLRADTPYVTYAIDISKKMIYEIAHKFYPKSKRPLFEISIDEAFMLFNYISKRLDELLDHKGLRFLKKFKISFIVGLYDVKENINENDIVKATKKYKLKNAFNAAKNALNIINPVYWIRKYVTSKAINIILKKLCVVMISVAGEETYKIYSKSIYNNEEEIDTGVDELIADLKETADKAEEEDFSETENILLLENNLDNKEEKKTKPNIIKNVFNIFKRKKDK